MKLFVMEFCSSHMCLPNCFVFYSDVLEICNCNRVCLFLVQATLKTCFKPSAMFACPLVAACPQRNRRTITPNLELGNEDEAHFCHQCAETLVDFKAGKTGWTYYWLPHAIRSNDGHTKPFGEIITMTEKVMMCQETLEKTDSEGIWKQFAWAPVCCNCMIQEFMTEQTYNLVSPGQPAPPVTGDQQHPQRAKPYTVINVLENAITWRSDEMKGIGIGWLSSKLQNVLMQH